MKLLVVGPGFKDTIYGITLEEGRIPSISSLTEEESKEFHIPDIEPAIWFKTLVLSSVTVHCVKRQITWSADAQNNNKQDNFQSSFISTCTLDSISEDGAKARSEDYSESKNWDKLLRKKRKSKFDRAKRMSESMFLHANGAGQNTDLDELFNLTNEVIVAYDTNNISKLEFYQELFRLLHCYILPSITFNKDDVPELKAALEFQTALITRQDDKISSKFSESEKIAKSMHSQRANYGKEIEGLAVASKLEYPHPLAITLLNDFQEDLQSLSTQLAEAQTDVNILKGELKSIDIALGRAVSTYLKGSSLSDDPSIDNNFLPDVLMSEFTSVNIREEAKVHAESDSKRQEIEAELSGKRDIRDKIFEEYKQVLHLREILSEYVSDRVLIKSDSKSRVTKRQIIRSKLKLKGKKTVEYPLHKIYMNLVDLKNDKIKEVQGLIEQKVKLVSVKEGIKSALDELQTANTAYGVDFDNFGSLRSTDVMSRPGLPKSWQTLEELVKKVIDDSKHSVTQIHVNGCNRILTECKLLKKFHTRYLESETDSGTHKGSPDTASLTDSVATCGCISLSTRSSFSASYESYQKGIHSMPERRRSNSYSQGQQQKNFEDSGKGEEDNVFLVHVPYGGMCIPLQNVACVDDNINDKFYGNSQRSSCSSLVQFEEVGESVTSDDLVIIHDVSPDYARKALDKIQKTIKEHMDKMCKHLQNTLDKQGQLNYQKIWSCYERIFFTVVHGSLEQIYKLAYLDILKGLKDSVPRLTPQALAMMEDSIVYKLFCDKTPVVVDNANDDLKNNGDVEEGETSSNHSAFSGEIAQENSLNIKSLMRKNRFVSEPSLLETSGTTTVKEKQASMRQKIKKVNRETTIYDEGKELTVVDFENSAFESQKLPPCDEHMPILMENNGQTLALETFDIIPDTAVDGNDDDPCPSMHSLPIMSLNDGDGDSASCSNLNMDLAESLIANSASGHLAKQMPSEYHETNVGTLNFGRSKYANVLEKINMDYARQLQKNVHVYYPVTVNFHNSDRSTWPLVNRTLEFGEDALITSIPTQEDLDKLEESTSFNDKPLQRNVSIRDFSKKSIKLKPEFREKLQCVVLIFQEMCNECTPTDKLKKGFVALRELGNQVFHIAQQLVGRGVGASADELSDFLVILLCNIDMKLLVKLYISVQMMRDLIPEFLETGPYGFAVMQLTIGLHFLQERIVMQRGLIHNDMARAYHEV